MCPFRALYTIHSFLQREVEYILRFYYLISNFATIQSQVYINF
jgi:hypothetical protein